MAPIKKSLIERVEARTERSPDGLHLIWTGHMRRRRPHLAHYGNPVRILLKIDTEHISVYPACLEPRCVDPYHWRVVRDKVWRYDGKQFAWTDPRTNLTTMQQEMVDLEVECILKGDSSLEDAVRSTNNPDMAKEITRRYLALAQR